MLLIGMQIALGFKIKIGVAIWVVGVWNMQPSPTGLQNNYLEPHGSSKRHHKLFLLCIENGIKANFTWAMPGDDRLFVKKC